MSGSHSNAAGVNGKSSANKDPHPEYGTPSEHHDFQFRGVFAPAEILDLLRDGKISPTEFALLLVIDGLVKSKGVGCWASNHYLGECISRTEDHVKRLVSHLKSLKLIKVVGSKEVNGYHYRVLETRWSRVTVPPQQKKPKRNRGGMGAPPRGGMGAPHMNTPLQEYSEIERNNPPTPRGTGSPSARPSREGRGQCADQFFEDDEEQTNRDTSPDSPSARPAPVVEEHQDTDEFFDGYPEGAPVWTVGHSSNYTGAQPDESEEEDEDTPSAPAEPAPEPKTNGKGALPDPFAKRNSPVQRLVNRLHKILYTKRGTHFAPSEKWPPKVWEHWMRELLKVRSEEQVSELLAWYAQHIGDKLVKNCGGPKQFFQRYAEIESCRARATPTEQELADELDRKDGKIPPRRY